MREFGEKSVMLQAAHDVQVDRAGLYTGTCVFRVHPSLMTDIPGIGASHPIFVDLTAEKIRLAFTPGLWTVYVDYAGFPEGSGDESDPYYELSVGVGTEPIETHPDFGTVLAGTPAKPENGAVFVNPKDGIVTISMVPGNYEFSKFAEFSGEEGDKIEGNPYAGLKSYLTANNTVWTKSWTQRSQPDDDDEALPLVVVKSPPGDAPKYKNHNWLQHPVCYQKRGNAYSCTQRWLLSGPQGWNLRVYELKAK